jgi:hypothetical protein
MRDPRKPPPPAAAVQPKSHPAPPVRWPVAAQTPPPVVQRFGWAILDSRATKHDDPEIVRSNIELASRYYRGHEVTTDPDKVKSPQKVNLDDKEPLHIHGHGTDVSLGGFKAASLAQEVLRKFKTDQLKGRTILLHSCEVGSGSFLRDFLRALASNNFKGWHGTTVCGPKRFLIVNEQGVSQVSKPNVKESQLSTRKGQFGNVERKGVDWSGVRVLRGSIQSLTDIQTLNVVNWAMKRG